MKIGDENKKSPRWRERPARGLIEYLQADII